MSGMFAIVVSGRLVQTDFQQVDVNKFLITIPNVDTINHIVVFMTGTVPLQPDMGASIHFSWPNVNQPVTVWKYLGMLNNDKPSAIFKITNLKGKLIKKNSSIRSKILIHICCSIIRRSTSKSMLRFLFKSTNSF